MARLEVRAEYSLRRNAIEMYVVQDLGSAGTAVGQPIMMEKIAENAAFGAPTLSLQYEQAQQLMDELWRCGLRPTEGSGSAGSLAATERHLKDMQVIARGLLRKDGVNLDAA